jgi:uncharacterized protein YdeI (YjbR/CyaY-like superfamily)
MIQNARDVDVPLNLAQALRQARAAAATRDVLSYGHKRAHVSTIVHVKGLKARARRVEQTIDHLLEEQIQ